MEITLEAVDQIKERTGVSYAEAKEALVKNEGNVVDAIIALEEASKSEDRAEAIIEKIKQAFKAGNLTKIQMKKDDKVILTIPVNVGIVGGVVGASLAPWAIIPAALAAYGFDCKFELIKDDGSTEDVE
ncbi:MAG: DUF4342 domain-containing protein [Lachnospiraceae bacterium]|nr:DUF4342 domain-containing protein [Lachnospiraceae bacterium]